MRRARLVLLVVIAAGCGGGAGSTTSTPAPPTTSPPAAVAAASTTTIAPPSGEPVTIAFGGDIHFDGALATTLKRSPGSILAGVAPALATADLAVVNLETAIGTGGDRAPKQFAFLAPPEALDALVAGGVDVIAMANNHSLDYGQEGLRQTLAAIAGRRAPVIGVGADEDAAFRPFTATVKGQRIAVINATQVLDSNLIDAWTATGDQPGLASAKRVDRLVEEVRAARSGADTVVVFLHWGTEATRCPNAAQRELAATLAAAGADVVVGGHAHRVLGGGYLGNAYVGYGLGNFVFVTRSAEGRESGVLTVTVDGRRVERAQWAPARIGVDFLPRLLQGAEADAARAAWEQRRGCAGLSATPEGP